MHLPPSLARRRSQRYTRRYRGGSRDGGSFRDVRRRCRSGGSDFLHLFIVVIVFVRIFFAARG